MPQSPRTPTARSVRSGWLPRSVLIGRFGPVEVEDSWPVTSSDRAGLLPTRPSAPRCSIWAFRTSAAFADVSR